MQALARLSATRFPRPRLRRPELSWEAVAFLGIALGAMALRLWELDGRTMHYDESLHVHYAWRLANGEGYSHSPWMHGPFQVELTAVIFWLFSDTDFTARLAYVLFGTALVFLPFFFRTHLGTTGAIVVAVLLALSPSLLYFSRFGRNEIIMSVWTVALLILLWRYLHEGKDRYLYMASAVLALMFATKETAYIVAVIFGAILFLISLPELVAVATGRIRPGEMSRAPALLILMITLTLPQWSAGVSVFQDSLGVVLANSDGGTGEVGLPLWGPPYAVFPVADLPMAADVAVLTAAVGMPVVALFTRWGRRWTRWLLGAGVVGALSYAFLALPHGFVARDWLIAFAVLAVTLVASAAIGMLWRWKVWLLCAAIFYLIWTTLYTSLYGLFVQAHGYCPTETGGALNTLCAKVGGVFTGSWQGFGYWLAQQEVARGGQPWYYHFITGSLYEFLPLLFGLAAIVYFVRRADLLGLALALWALLTFLAYTIASEKMPWLIVNIAVPFILLSGKLIGELIDRLHWRRVLGSPSALLLALAPLALVTGIYLLKRSLDQGSVDWQGWGLGAAILAMLAASALLVRRSRPGVGMSLAGLGVAALMLGFSSFVGFRVSYSYDDTPVEMLVYAQGSADIVRVLDDLEKEGVIPDELARPAVEMDYEIWYPMNWYVRQAQRDGMVEFRCYKAEGEPGYESWCNPVSEPPSTRAILLIEDHAKRYESHLAGHDASGPLKDLLWFPEDTYRRPTANREKQWSPEELKDDVHFIVDNMTAQRPWKDAIDYFIFRRLNDQWWDSKFFSYVSPRHAGSGVVAQSIHHPQ